MQEKSVSSMSYDVLLASGKHFADSRKPFADCIIGWFKGKALVKRLELRPWILDAVCCNVMSVRLQYHENIIIMSIL